MIQGVNEWSLTCIPNSEISEVALGDEVPNSHPNAPYPSFLWEQQRQRPPKPVQTGVPVTLLDVWGNIWEANGSCAADGGGLLCRALPMSAG